MPWIISLLVPSVGARSPAFNPPMRNPITAHPTHPRPPLPPSSTPPGSPCPGFSHREGCQKPAELDAPLEDDARLLVHRPGLASPTGCAGAVHRARSRSVRVFQGLGRRGIETGRRPCSSRCQAQEPAGQVRKGRRRHIYSTERTFSGTILRIMPSGTFLVEFNLE